MVAVFLAGGIRADRCFADSPSVETPAGEQVELPFETALDGETIRLELRHATIDILQDPEAEASLSVGWLTPGEASDERVDVRVKGGLLQLSRGGSTTPTEPRWLVEMVVAPEQFVEIVGVDLDVLIEAAANEDEGSSAEEEQADGYLDDEKYGEKYNQEEGGKGDEKEAKTRPGRDGLDSVDEPTVDLHLEQSNVHLVGLEGAIVDTFESYLRADRTTGILRLRMQGGSAEIVGHRGPMELSAHQAEIWLEEPESKLTFSLEGGTLNSTGGEGRIEGKVRDAFVRFEGWTGPNTLEASEASLEVISATEANLQISGAHLAVVVENIQGQVETRLLGGTLTGRDLVGHVKITARSDAEVELEGIKGPVSLSLESGAGVKIIDAEGIVQGNVHDARLDVDGASYLKLSGLRAEVSLSRLDRIQQLELTDSRLEADLSGLRHDPLLTLRGTSEASVQIEAPCGVKLEKTSEDPLARVDVSGCMMHGQSQGRVVFGRRGLEGNRQMMLKLALSPGSTVDVEGLY